MSKVTHKVGGTNYYNCNLTLPYVSGSGGSGYSTVSTLAATPYPEPAAGNMFLLKNTDDSNKLSLAFYDGTNWKCVGKNT